MPKLTPLPTTKSFAVRLGEPQKAAIARTAKKVGLNFSDTVRKAIELGLPVLEERLGKQETKL